MGETANVDIDDLGRLVYDCINEFGVDERQRAALERIFDILTEHTDFAKNVIRCSVCGGDRLSVAKVGSSPGYHQCAVCYAEDMLVDGQEER
jgi:hypothetical protein